MTSTTSQAYRDPIWAKRAAGGPVAKPEDGKVYVAMLRGSHTILEELVLERVIPSQPGLYELGFIKLGENDEPVFTFRGGMESFLEEAKLWRRHLQDRVFFCDQCSYFNENAQAVQEHSVSEHDCRCETYQDAKGRIRVKTTKCHPRVTVKPGVSQEARAERMRGVFNK